MAAKQYYQQESVKLRNQIQMLQNTNSVSVHGCVTWRLRRRPALPRAVADEAGGMKARALLEHLAWPFSSRHSSSESRREKEPADPEAITAREQRAFQYEALAAATRGFSEKNRLWQGGFGPCTGANLRTAATSL
ncbi:hypothetical protein C2845_PM03G32190 [Panicum miliaceum]|uniref:Uncharacterized protein n=1 Tax=Panicum miliaceum TaxID=4540 RepID=A0A3L6TB76_PANMI|nr:hypothetical protein C2845_PM03G32190 [Panicum miliaceum]